MNAQFAYVWPHFNHKLIATILLTSCKHSVHYNNVDSTNKVQQRHTQQHTRSLRYSRMYLRVLSQTIVFGFQCLFLTHPLTPSLFHHLPRVKVHSRATRDCLVICLTGLSGRVLLTLAVEIQYWVIFECGHIHSSKCCKVCTSYGRPMRVALMVHA